MNKKEVSKIKLSLEDEINNSKTDGLASIETYLSNSADFTEKLIVAVGGKS